MQFIQLIPKLFKAGVIVVKFQCYNRLRTMEESVFYIWSFWLVHSLFLNPLSMMTHDYTEGIGLLNVIILLTHLTRSNTILNPVGLNLIISKLLKLTVQAIIRKTNILSYTFWVRIFVSSTPRQRIEKQNAYYGLISTK